MHCSLHVYPDALWRNSLSQTRTDSTIPAPAETILSSCRPDTEAF
jgi:hypothetical protein